MEKSDDLILELLSCYLQLIGILLWVMELGRINIFTEVVVMAQYSASPKLRHLEGLYHMFECLWNHEMYRVVFDPFQTNVGNIAFESSMMDWRSFLWEYQIHWLKVHTRRVLLMLTTLVTLLLQVFTYIS